MANESKRTTDVVEIIRLRLAKLSHTDAVAKINELAARLKLENVQVYRHVFVEGDISIHLRHPDARFDTESKGRGPALLLKEYGLVSYSRWASADEPG